MAVKTGTLVPGLSGSHNSAKSHSGCRGSTTIILAPCFSIAAFICKAMIGCSRWCFEPVTMNTSLRSLRRQCCSWRRSRWPAAGRRPSRHGTAGCSGRHCLYGTGREHLLQQVVVLVGGFGRTGRWPGRPARPGDRSPPAGRRYDQGLIPRDLAPFLPLESLGTRAGLLRASPHQRGGDPPGV